MKLGRMKLRNQIFLILALAVASISLLQLFYYYSFNRVIAQSTSLYMQSIMNKIQEELNSQAAALKKISLEISTKSDVQNYLATDDYYNQLVYSKPVDELLVFSSSYHKDIDNILIYDTTGKTRYAYPDKYFKNMDSIRQVIEKYITKSEQSFRISERKPVFSGIIRNEETRQSFYALISPIFDIKTGSSEFYKYTGSVLVLCRLELLKSIIDNVGLTKNSFFVIIDSENNLLVDSSETGSISREVIAGINFKSESDIIKEIQKKLGRNTYLISSREIGANGWKVYGFVPRSEVTTEIRSASLMGLVVEIITIFILVLLALVLMRNITQPVAKIIHFINTINNDTPAPRLILSTENEIGGIARYINRMLDRLYEMNQNIVTSQKQLYEEELLKKKFQLSSLQNQINPHFLYNTLDNIRSIALANGIMEIVEVSTSMAAIFRYAIKEEMHVQVKGEIDCILRYIKIMNIRFNNKFQLTVDIDGRLMEKKIIKMILQPIVENAIYHGLEGKKEKGCITIRGRFDEEGKILFEIQDNGKGMSPEELEQLNHALASQANILESVNASRSIGLSNINSRIRILYGNEYGVRVTSRQNEGTVLTVKLPVIDTLTT